MALKRSSTLEPPRKSIELEDPGAHDLEASENEEDIFSDAQEDRGTYSGRNSPIPTTRVEKVDDHENYGEVPGTSAYKMRMQDAVPDELEIIPDGEESKHAPGLALEDTSHNAAAIPIPKTVVQKVDPASPSHGEVPGTVAHAIRKADAVPDVIVQISDPDVNIPLETKSESSGPADWSTSSSDREESGEEVSRMRKGNENYEALEDRSIVPDLPTPSLNRSTFSTATRIGSSMKGVFPMAEDGGFGPMHDEGTGGGSTDVDVNIHMNGESGAESGQGEDFDDFEAGAGDDDFGDFDDGFQQQSFSAESSSDTQKYTSTEQAVSPSPSPFPLLDFSQFDSTDDLISASAPYLDEIFPTTQGPPSPPLPQTDENYSIFLTERSLSLWSQLMAPPPLQPPNWVRSRIRRLFLVSLGVPVDLDEILPASKQKKLVLPSIDIQGGSRSPSKGGHDGSRVQLKQDNTSSASVDQPSNQKPNRRRKGPPPPPELDLGKTKMLCMTTEAALSNLSDDELREHIGKLEELTARASEVLEYWLKRKDNALGDKEVFEGVIENLVKHARRVRK